MQGSTTQQPRGSDLIAYYNAVRSYTETLCEPLGVEDYMPQPVIDVSPPKWNIAHTTWFFEEMILSKFCPRYDVFNKNYAFLFNSYYNSIGSRTPRHKRGDISRPTVGEVFEYRKYVDGKMNELLAGEISDEVRDLVTLGLNHEQQHQELFLTDLKYILSVNPLEPVYRPDFALSERDEIDSNELIAFAGGIFDIGFTGDGFHFDNELGRHRVLLNDFEIQKNVVTNAEYLEFIEDGGYKNFLLWHSDGWDWVNENGVGAPLYWRKKDGEWYQFTLAGLRRINPKNPVCHISFYEAAAFADWKKMRLPTEFEWEAAAGRLKWGSRWEWTNSAYLPYPGYQKAPGAVGEYNGKFMVNQMVLRGASVATPAGHSRITYRNFFQPPLRWQFTGIRLAK